MSLFEVFKSRSDLSIRAVKFLIHCTRQRDWFGLALFGLLILVGVSAVSILFSQTMKEAALKRFHLASDSFPNWAAHQIVPAMYNFENRIKFSNVINDQGRFDPSEDSYLESAVNHFPARFITFGDQRPVFSNDKDGMFEMQSVFGDTSLVSRWNITHDQPGKLTVHRVEQRFDRNFDRLEPPSESRGRDE